MNALVYALNKTEINRISHCLTETWNTLQVTNELTSLAKESNIALLNTKFENFKMTASKGDKEMLTIGNSPAKA